MAEESFSTAVMLEAQVDPGSLRSTRDEIESSLSDTLVIDVEPSVGGGGAGSTGGMPDLGKSQRKGNRLAQENLELDVERNVLLEELVENAEDDTLNKRVGGGGIGMGLILGALTSGLLGGLRNFEWPKIDVPEFPDLDVAPPPFDVPIPVGAPEFKIPEIPTLEVPTIDPLGVPTIPPLRVPTIPPLHVPEIPELDVPPIPDLGYDGPTEIPVTFPTTFPDVPGSVVAGGAAGVAAGGAAYGLSKGSGGGVVNVGARGGAAGRGMGIPAPFGASPIVGVSDQGGIQQWIRDQLGRGGSQTAMRGRTRTGTVTGSQNAARQNRQQTKTVDVTNHVQVDATDDRQVKKTVDDELSKFEGRLERKLKGKRGGLR